MELLAFGKNYDIQKLGDVIVNHINEVLPNRFEEIIDYLESNHDFETVRRTLLFLDILRLLDSMASGNPDACAGSHIITAPSEYGFVAQYEPESDSYGVFLDQISFMPDGDSVFKNQLFEHVSLSPDILLLGVAMHEVRHRLQHQKRVELFTKDSYSNDSFVNEHIIFNKIFCSCVDFVKGHEEIEFDTHLIQRHFLSLVAGKSTLSLDTILDCLFLEVEND
jgi:hypothetical protein